MAVPRRFMARRGQQFVFTPSSRAARHAHLMEKTCLIAGASGGVGSALARLLLERGWRTVLATRNATRLHSDAGQIVEADIATPQGAAHAVTAASSHFGAAPAAFVNAAGSVLIAPISRTPEAHYREVMRANLDTAFFGMQAWLGAVPSGTPGAAVLFSSVVAGTGVANHAAIAAAKGGVEALVRSVAADHSARGVRVNAIAPGLLRGPGTEKMLANDASRARIAAQYPLGRHGEALDAAYLAAWLLSDEAGWITGQVIGLDGGFGAVRPMVRSGP